MEKLSFTGAMRQFFGIRPDGYKGKQGLMSFAEELKELSYEEKQSFVLLLAKELNAEVEQPVAPIA